MRIKHLSESIEKNGLDAYIITREPNIFYYAGTTSGGIMLLAPGSDSLLLVSRLNLSEAQDQVQGVEVKPYTRENMVEKLSSVCDNIKPDRIGYDHLSLQTYQRLDELLDVELESKPDLVWDMRKIKGEEELKYMRKAAKLSDIGMQAAEEFIREGVKEYEIAAEVAYAMRKAGAEDYAFPFIVASGPRSAYPHAGVTDRRIEKGDFITIDMGARYHEYCADLTRTFIVGHPTDRHREIYETVLEANNKALTKMIDGTKGVEVDMTARKIIEEKGFKDNFVHSLGHGVGLEVHEPPSLSEKSGDTLRAGNIVTDEPGIYIPGYGGVRIEDTVLITTSAPEVFTNFPRTLDSITI